MRNLGRLAARLVVALLAISVAMAAVRALVGAVDASPAVASGLRRAGLFLAALGGYAAAARWHERRGMPELALRPLAAGVAAGIGGAMISVTTVSLYLLGAYRVAEVRGWQGELLGIAAVIWIAAFLEELVYRGVVFRHLEAAWGLPAALGVQAVLFGLVHLDNEGAGWTAMASVTLLGALWALIYVRTRNLWVVAAHHAGWNFAIVLAGAPLSGIEDWRAASPIDAVAAGPDWLTGGAFGPETSPITLVLVSVAVGALLGGSSRRRPAGA